MLLMLLLNILMKSLTRMVLNHIYSPNIFNFCDCVMKFGTPEEKSENEAYNEECGAHLIIENNTFVAQ